MIVKKIGKTQVILLIAILMISTATFTMLPSAAADVYASGVTNYPWPQGRADAKNTGYTAASAPKTNQTSWIYDTGSSDIVRSGPTVVDGVVYTGSDNNALFALDMVTGALKWKHKTGGDCRSAAAVVGDLLFITDRSGELTCLNKNTGVYQWSYLDPYALDCRSSPTVYNNGTHDLVIYGIRSNDTNPNVIARTTGNVPVWTFTAGSGAAGSNYRVDGKPAVANNGTHDLVFAGSQNNRLYAIDLKTGLQAWVYNVGVDIIRGPVVDCDNATVFAAAKNRAVMAFYLNGTSKWNNTGPSDQRGGLAVAYGKVYAAGTNNGVVWALDASTGATVWTKPGLAIGSWYGIPCVADGLVFVIDYDGVVYALDANNGNVVWTYDTATTAIADEAYGAVADGRLFIGSGPSSTSKVYCFGYRGLYIEGCNIVDEYDICESFTVEIKVENVTDLWSYGIALRWDPAVLECTGVAYVDTFLPDTAEDPAAFVTTPGEINNIIGEFNRSYGRGLMYPNTKGVTGSGTLITVTFHVIGYGETWISFIPYPETPSTGLLNSKFEVINVPLQKCWFKLTPPPAVPCKAIINENATSGPVGTTYNIWSESLDAHNGTETCSIIREDWNITKDGTGEVVFSTSLGRHSEINWTCEEAGTFTVLLEIWTEVKPGLPSGYEYNSTTSKKENWVLIPIHDVAVTQVIRCIPKQLLYPGNATMLDVHANTWTVCINVTVKNVGNFTESFNVKAYYDNTVIGTKAVTSLAPGASIKVDFKWTPSMALVHFNWTTNKYTSIYTIKAEAVLATDANPADNVKVDGKVMVVMTGDVNQDGIISGGDLTGLGINWGKKPGDPGYYPKADINFDAIISGGDLTGLGFYWGDIAPP